MPRGVKVRVLSWAPVDPTENPRMPRVFCCQCLATRAECPPCRCARVIDPSRTASPAWQAQPREPLRPARRANSAAGQIMLVLAMKIRHPTADCHGSPTTTGPETPARPWASSQAGVSSAAAKASRSGTAALSAVAHCGGAPYPRARSIFGNPNASRTRSAGNPMCEGFRTTLSASRAVSSAAECA